MIQNYTLSAKTTVVFFAVLLGFVVLSCRQVNDSVDWSKGETLLAQGSFIELEAWVDALKHQLVSGESQWAKADSFGEISHRLELEFPYTEVDVIGQLNERMGFYSDSDKSQWEQNGKLEFRWINGEKRYFKRAVSNLLLLISHEEGCLIDDALAEFCLVHTRQVVDSTRVDGQVVAPQLFDVTYRINVKADVVPPGKTIRCWMPWPKELHQRQTDVIFKGASETDYTIAPDSCLHRSIYMEKVASAGDETTFETRFSFVSHAQYFDLNKMEVEPYQKASALYKQYTCQQKPHLVFSDRIKHLADSVVGEATHPIEMVRRIYYWIDANIPWAGALEYSVMPCIPEYVLSRKRGDCGMQTLLFMSMARYKGIPVKWQSGWMMHPGEVNLHDWCEVYYEGVGWVPLDMTFNLQQSENKLLKEFYLSGIDAYRLIINDGIGASFCPAKKFLRSEPWDFQRGEVEWDGGNLYFNQWSYELIVNE